MKANISFLILSGVHQSIIRLLIYFARHDSLFDYIDTEYSSAVMLNLY